MTLRTAQKPLDAKDVEIAKLRGALAVAPRPKPGATAEWMVTYMDWYFQHRISALGETAHTKEG